MFVLLAIVGKGQILQWDLMDIINILRSWDKSMFIRTGGSTPKRFAKFGRPKRTFCGKKEEKADSQIKSQAIVTYKVTLYHKGCRNVIQCDHVRK